MILTAGHPMFSWAMHTQLPPRDEFFSFKCYIFTVTSTEGMVATCVSITRTGDP